MNWWNKLKTKWHKNNLDDHNSPSNLNTVHSEVNSQDLLGELESLRQKYLILNQQLVQKIQAVNTWDQNKLQQNFNQAFLSQMNQDLTRTFNERYEVIKNQQDKIARDLVLEAMGRINYEYFKEDVLFKVTCKNPETKSRLIGLNGRNKKAFEKTTGMELIINEQDVISICSANLVKREVAKHLLLRLLETKNIEPNKIENYYQEELARFNQQLELIGKDIVENKLQVYDLDPKIYWYVGRLKYRVSFGQNVLEHSLEVGYLAEMLAGQLGLDPKLAKLCGFFHDIGKSVDHETGKSHVWQGVEIAEECHLDPAIIHSIEAHHDDVMARDEYACLTKIADKASASKPGARNNTKDDFFKRVEIYEQICSQFAEVKTCWVLKSGFAIKVLVKPALVKDEELQLLGFRIKEAFENHPETKSYSISIELIKENTFKTKTSATLD